jgi:hypothetical protein
MAKHYKTYGRKYLKVAFVFLCHLVLIALTVSGIWVLERLFHVYWQTTEPLLFDHVPLKYPFQFIDLVIILLFGYRGFREINEILKG